MKKLFLFIVLMLISLPGYAVTTTPYNSFPFKTTLRADDALTGYGPSLTASGSPATKMFNWSPPQLLRDAMTLAPTTGNAIYWNGTNYAPLVFSSPFSVSGGTASLSGQASGLWGTQLTSYATINAIGDSITCGTGAVNTACSTVGFINTVAADGGMALINQAVQGDEACEEAALMVVNSLYPSLTSNTMYSMLNGVNDAAFGGTGGYEAVYMGCHQAMLSWLTVPAEYKVAANTCTKTGTWVAAPQWPTNIGAKSNTNGSTLSCPITTTKTGAIYAWYANADSDGGTFTYSLDGGSPVSISTATTPPIFTHHSTTTGATLIRIPGVSAGSHTVLFTVTSATNTGNNVSIGAIGAPAPLNYRGAPLVVSGGTLRQMNDTQAAVTAAYDADTHYDNLLLAGDGLPIRDYNVRAYVNATTDMFDSPHPNATGHLHLAQAIEAVLQFPYKGGGSASAFGTSATSTSPGTSTDAGTGLYTAGAGLVDVAISGVKAAEFTGRFLTLSSSNTLSMGLGLANSTGHSYTWVSTGSGSSSGAGVLALSDATSGANFFGGYGGTTGGVGSLILTSANTTIGWNASSGSSTTFTSEDTGMSRSSAGVVAFGTGTQGSTAGSILANNATFSGTLTGANLKAGENNIAASTATTTIPVVSAIETVTLSSNTTFSMVAGAAGQQICLLFIQDVTGSRTVTAPANVLGFFTVGATASKRNEQCFTYSAALTAWTPQSSGVINF